MHYPHPMESIEQTSAHTKRKLGSADDLNHEHFYAFDIEHEQTTKSFCCRSSPPTASNYQQTTKIIQEFNIQQSTSSDITVSSTINIKSTSKQPCAVKQSTNEFLSEADFQRVVQDITPADRDLFDEFLNGIKQKTDDYLFISSFDDPPATSQEQDSISRRHSSLSLPSSSSSLIAADRRRNSIPRGSSTIHYSPHSTPISNRAGNTAAAAQTLKQMAVQHQQRAIYNQQYSTTPYNQNSVRPYYQRTENDSTAYYQQTNTYPSTAQSNIYGIQNYSYQTSTSFYQQQQQTPSSSSYLINNYPPSNSLPSISSSSNSTSFYAQEDHLSLLDL